MARVKQRLQFIRMWSPFRANINIVCVLMCLMAHIYVSEHRSVPTTVDKSIDNIKTDDASALNLGGKRVKKTFVSLLQERGELENTLKISSISERSEFNGEPSYKKSLANQTSSRGHHRHHRHHHRQAHPLFMMNLYDALAREDTYLVGPKGDDRPGMSTAVQAYFPSKVNVSGHDRVTFLFSLNAVPKAGTFDHAELVLCRKAYNTLNDTPTLPSKTVIGLKTTDGKNSYIQQLDGPEVSTAVTDFSMFNITALLNNISSSLISSPRIQLELTFYVHYNLTGIKVAKPNLHRLYHWRIARSHRRSPLIVMYSDMNPESFHFWQRRPVRKLRIRRTARIPFPGNTTVSNISGPTTPLLSESPIVANASDGEGVQPSILATNTSQRHRVRFRHERDLKCQNNNFDYPRYKEVSTDTDRVYRIPLCGLKQWRLRFSNINFNWIIAPLWYCANICVGHCSSPLTDNYYNTTNYAQLKNFYHMMTNYENTDDVPRASCVPIRYHPMSVLFERLDGSVAVERMTEMSAASCGCL